MKPYLKLLCAFMILPCVSCAFDFPQVSFSDSMGKTTVLAAQQESYAFIQNLYNQNIFFNTSGNSDYKIPKKIHAIWLGSHPSERILKNFESWQKHHPTWECKLWTDENIKNFPLVNQGFYDQSSNYGQRSDIARYEILYKYGGVYIDCDFFCIKPFDILHQCYDFYTGVLKIGKKYVGLANGLIGSVPGHPILKQCIETMHVQPHEGKKEITASTGPGHFTKSFFAVASQCSDCIILPGSYLYPAPNTLRYQTVEKMNTYIKPESFAIHYWTNSWKEPSAKVKLRKKKLNEQAHVCVFAPHPDDDILGCGGAIANHLKQGNHVTVVFMTSGEKGNKYYAKNELALLREQEAQKAQTVLGCSDLIFLRNPDGKLALDKITYQQIKTIVATHKSEYIYIPHALDDHSDHVMTHRIVMAVLRELVITENYPMPTVLCYEVWTPLQNYSIAEPITKVMSLKIQALHKHTSQLENMAYAEAIAGLNRYRGVMTRKGHGYCECFYQVTREELEHVA